MATYNISTSVNIDSLTTKGGNDTYNINGGYLTVDQDSRYGTNNTTSAIMGNITLSATLGGTIEFNAENVRLIAYDTGSGTVPASNTTITDGIEGSGKLIGVYSALNAAPTAAGAAMPASGFIKIKQWNGLSFNNGRPCTGISASVVSDGTADFPGWIEIAGADSATITVNRLNTFKVRGTWYDFRGEVTTGNRTSTYQIPTNGSSVFYLPGVWVETGSETDQYEFYPCAGSRTALVANIGVESNRGKFCWISTSGVLRFGHDGTNSTGGYLPPIGRRIRVPNIFFMCSTSGAPTINALPNATLATRMDFTTTGGGVIDIDLGSMNWYLSVAQGYSCTLSNSSFMTAISLSEIASPMTISNIGVGQEAANTQVALTLANCYAGGTITDCILSRATLASSGNYILSLTDISGFTFTNLRCVSLTTRANATTGAATLTRVANSTFNNPQWVGGRCLLTTCTSCVFNDTTYIDVLASTTLATNPMYAYVLGTLCTDCTFDGLDFGGIGMVQPYAGLVNIGAAACSDIDIRNIGTYDSPLSLGLTGYYDVPWTRSLTTGTVIHTGGMGHGLKSGDILYVLISSDTSAIAVGSKTVLTPPAVTTSGFSFTCLNAGATTGTLSYYPTMAASLLVLDASAAAQNIYAKSIYTKYNRSVPFSSDNSSKNIVLQNVYADPIQAPVLPSLNQATKGLKCTPALTAQTATYGTHFIDYHIAELPESSTISVPWTRTTTTATGFTTGHNLYTNLLINVESSSSAAAIITGQKTITALNKNAFSFTCLNAGDATGTLTWSPLASRLAIQMNEQTTETSGIYTKTGSSSFTSAGRLVMTGINTDSITFTTPDYVIGYTGFGYAEPVMGGAALTGFNIYYSLDKNDGNGFSPYKNMSYTRTGSAGSNGSTTVTVANTSGINTGDYVWGTNIAPYAYVTGVTNSTTFLVSRPNIGTVSSVLRFNSLPGESGISPDLGFKQSVKIDSVQTGSTAITSLYWFLMSSSGSRRAAYPLDIVETSLNLINLKTGSEIHVYNSNTDIELAGIESTLGSSFTYDYTWTGANTSVYITALKTGYQWIRYSDQLLTQSGLTIPVFQNIDRNYSNP